MKERRLHIGALKSLPGWESLNALPLKEITHVTSGLEQVYRWMLDQTQD